MLKLLETTQWKCNQENHIYFVNETKEKLLAFQACGGSDVVTYDKPLRFNTRGRTFKQIK